MAMDISEIKNAFPVFTEADKAGSALHYLDNAATTHKPYSVIDSYKSICESDYGPVSRGLYPLAERATELYESARETVANFIGCNANSVVFTQGTTDSLNLVAQYAIKPILEKGDEVWITRAEHHSNYLPWIRICDESGAQLRVLEIDENAKLILPPLADLKSGKVKCLSISLISNVIGYYADVSAIIEQVKAAGVITVVDAAQAIANHRLNASTLGCDFLAFSGHKIYGPTGIGVLYVRPSIIESLSPFRVGGGMVDWVADSFHETEWSTGVSKLEAGSPNLLGAVGLAEAMKFVSQLPRKDLEQHIAELAITCGNTIKELPGFRLFGDESNWQSGIITFDHESIHPHDIAQLCGEEGVAIRAGHHCAQPLMSQLKVPATARVSFAIYNGQRDLEALVIALTKVEATFL